MQYYSCTALISDSGHGIFFLVHRYNGISIFSGDPIRLTNSICFYERDHSIGNCYYNETSQILALTFVWSGHEKVILLDMVTSEQSAIFFHDKSGRNCRKPLFQRKQWLFAYIDTIPVLRIQLVYRHSLSYKRSWGKWKICWI